MMRIGTATNMGLVAAKVCSELHFLATGFPPFLSFLALQSIFEDDSVYIEEKDEKIYCHFDCNFPDNILPVWAGD